MVVSVSAVFPVRDAALPDFLFIQPAAKLFQNLMRINAVSRTEDTAETLKVYSINLPSLNLFQKSILSIFHH